MSDVLQEANRAIDSILAYRLSPGRTMDMFDAHYLRLDDEGRHALFLAVCGRLLVEEARKRTEGRK